VSCNKTCNHMVNIFSVLWIIENRLRNKPFKLSKTSPSRSANGHTHKSHQKVQLLKENIDPF
jgi:hypothetical protein